MGIRCYHKGADGGRHASQLMGTDGPFLLSKGQMRAPHKAFRIVGRIPDH